MTVEVYRQPPRGNQRNHGKTANDRLAEAEAMTRDRALGMTQVQLMAKYNVSRQTVIRRLKLAVTKRLPESVDALRNQQNDAINVALTRIAHTIELAERTIADPNSTDLQRQNAILTRLQALKVMNTYLDRRARLNGLDAPTKVEGTIHHTVQEDIDLAEIIREAKERARA
jgi:hypothetical protein